MTRERTDIHRPSVIRPEGYDYIGIWYDPAEAGVVGGARVLREHRDEIKRHMETTGGTWATHAHGGSCYCCGAYALYLAVFFHEATREYIRIGERCTEKMLYGCSSDFATARRAVHDAREAIAGKQKAKLLLADMGLEKAWEIYELPNSVDFFEETTIKDIVGRLIRRGFVSDKQRDFIRSLLNAIEQRPYVRAIREAEKAAAKDCPTGRMVVTGVVLSTKIVESQWGDAIKMLVKTPDGYTLWGTVPSGLEASRGSEVIFKATVVPSDRDPKHGYFSRPSAQNGGRANL